MPTPLSKLAPDWWDYTTLEPDLLADAACMDERKLNGLSRAGFTIHFCDTVQEFYAAEALEYIDAWRQSTPDNPAGICGPIGPTEQLPVVAKHVFPDKNIRHLQIPGIFIPVALAAVDHQDIAHADWPRAIAGGIDTMPAENDDHFQKLVPVQSHRGLHFLSEDPDGCPLIRKMDYHTEQRPSSHRGGTNFAIPKWLAGTFAGNRPISAF